MNTQDPLAKQASLASLIAPGPWLTRLQSKLSPPLRYGIAAGISVGAILASLPFSNSNRLLLLLLQFVAALITAYFCGWRAAALTTVLCAGADLTGIVPRFPASDGISPAGAVESITLLVAGVFLSLRLESAQTAISLFEREHRKARRLEIEAEALRNNLAASRLESDAVRARLLWLASTSSLLVGSLDYRLTLERLGRAVVENIADWCLIDLVRSDGTIERVTAADADPQRQELMTRLKAFPPPSHGGHPVNKVMFSGQPEIIPFVDDAVLQLQCEKPEHLDLMRQIGVYSLAFLPMMARGRMLGVLTVAFRKPGMIHDSNELELARDLAHRASLGIDNAKLFAEAQEEIAERKRVERILVLHRQEIESLNARLQRAMTETHHRVKNNLQVITAMVDMQLMRDEDVISIAEMKRLGTHVSTLAAVHDLLTHQSKQDGNAEHVSAAEVLEKLLPKLGQTAGAHTIDFELDDVDLSVRQGTSLALVTNELVSNAIKHGNSKVTVTFKVTETDARLRVSDDGRGFPPGFNPSLAANTGLELVENLSRWDLAGSASYVNNPEGGACVEVTIPLSNPDVQKRSTGSPDKAVVLSRVDKSAKSLI